MSTLRLYPHECLSTVLAFSHLCFWRTPLKEDNVDSLNNSLGQVTALSLSYEWKISSRYSKDRGFSFKRNRVLRRWENETPKQIQDQPHVNKFELPIAKDSLWHRTFKTWAPGLGDHSLRFATLNKFLHRKYHAGFNLKFTSYKRLIVLDCWVWVCYKIKSKLYQSKFCLVP